MGKTEKPKSTWRERRKDIKRKWLSPFIYVEWLCERLSYRLGRWAFLEILGHISRFGILVSLVVGVYVYVTEADERIIQAENQRKAKHYQAWQIINIAHGKPGGGGRIDALQELNKDKVPLNGVDLSEAYLQGIDLKDANLSDANFSEAMLGGANLIGAYLNGADLSGANLISANLSGARLNVAGLSGAYLNGADLSGARLFSANLSGARLYRANLSEADLSYANLLNIEDWINVKSIEYANIYNVINEPNGFIGWATAPEQGAVIKTPSEWEAFLKMRRDKIAPRVTHIKLIKKKAKR